MARPQKYKIDGEEVFKLASFHCTNKEIAEFYGCDESLIRKNYSEFCTKGRAIGKTRLRKLLWRAAEKGSVVSMIWLSKQYLGMKERIESSEECTPLPWLD